MTGSRRVLAQASAKTLPALLAVVLMLVGCTGEPATQSTRTAGQSRRTPAAVVTAGADKTEGDLAPAEEGVQHGSHAGWPALFGPSRDSSSAETGVAVTWPEAGPPELWRREIGLGYASPVAVEGRLVVLHREGDQEHLDAMHPATGERLWRYSHPTTYQCPVDYSDGPYSTPVICHPPDGPAAVVCVSAQGVMSCVRLDDGQLIWRRALHEEYPVEPWLFPVGASPLVEGGGVYFALGSIAGEAGVIALRVSDGATLWTATAHGPSYATPILAEMHGTRYLFTPTAEGLVSLDPDNGHVHWLYPMKRGSPDACNATSPVVFGDTVIMVTGPGPGAACLRVLPGGAYRRVWRDRRVLDSQFNTLFPVGDYLYGYTATKQGGATFRCVHAGAGDLQWQHYSDLGRGSGLRVGGHFLLWGEAGHLASVEVRSDKPVEKAVTAEPLLDPPCYASPALLNGLLYLRNEGTLVCLDLRAGRRRRSP